MNFLPQIKLFDLYYGQPASGKSECAARVIEQVYRETGKKARLVIGDGSLMTYRHLLDAGIAESVSFQARSWPTSVLYQLASGWWPWLKAGESDESHSELRPPDIPYIKDNIGIYVFEGISTAATYMIGDIKGGCCWHAAHGTKIGQDASYKTVDADVDPKTRKAIEGTGPGLRWGGTAQAHYLYVQTKLPTIIQQSNGLPCHVIWTAHETVNDPEKNPLIKEQIAGPEVIGKALTDKIQRVFGNTVHMQSVGKRVKHDDTFTNRKVDEFDLEFRCYTRDHFHPNGTVLTRFKGCTRNVDAKKIAQYFVGADAGVGILDYYKALHEISLGKQASLVGPKTIEGA